MVKCISLNFSVLESSCSSVLAIADFSEWGEIANSPAIVEITLPAGIEPYTFEWNKGAINYYDTISFRMACKTTDVYPMDDCFECSTPIEETKCELGCEVHTTPEPSCSSCGSYEELMSDLPDGIYKIKLIGSPSSRNIEKYHLRTSIVDLEMAQILISIDDITSRDFYNYRTLKFLLNSAHANIKLGNNLKAAKIYQDFLNKLEEYKRTC